MEKPRLQKHLQEREQMCIAKNWNEELQFVLVMLIQHSIIVKNAISIAELKSAGNAFLIASLLERLAF